MGISILCQGGWEARTAFRRADTEPPLAGFGVYGGCTALRLHGELPGILISIWC